MARVTVEDCIEKVENRFDLVLMAAHRARMISSGAQITVPRDNDKNPVVALREIGDATISTPSAKKNCCAASKASLRRKGATTRLRLENRSSGAI